MSHTPYIGFGHDTLAQCDPLVVGDEIDCPKCGGKHAVEGSKPVGVLLFYRCGGTSYLAGVKGRSIVGVKADCSGNIPGDQERS